MFVSRGIPTFAELAALHNELSTVQIALLLLHCYIECIFPHRSGNGGIALSMSNSPV